MNKKLKAAAQRLKKDKKLLLITALGLCGMLLLLFSSAVGSGGGAKVQEESAEGLQKSMTQELEKLLGSVQGVGRVRVLITLDSLTENIYVKNRQEEEDENGSKLSEDYVIIENANVSGGLASKQIMPAVRGVAVCCEGAASALVRQEVTNTVAAAYGIATSRIWVTKMQNE